MSFLEFLRPVAVRKMALGLMMEWAHRRAAARGRTGAFSAGVGQPMLLAPLPAVGLSLALS